MSLSVIDIPAFLRSNNYKSYMYSYKRTLLGLQQIPICQLQEKVGFTLESGCNWNLEFKTPLHRSCFWVSQTWSQGWNTISQVRWKWWKFVSWELGLLTSNREKMSHYCQFPLIPYSTPNLCCKLVEPNLSLSTNKIAQLHTFLVLMVTLC